MAVASRRRGARAIREKLGIAGSGNGRTAGDVSFDPLLENYIYSTVTFYWMEQCHS
jgi:hypothetical protein